MTIEVKKPRSTGLRIPVNGHTYTPYIGSGTYRQHTFCESGNVRLDQEFNKLYDNEEL